MLHRCWKSWAVSLLGLCCSLPAAERGDVAALVQAIKKVGREGAGHREAAQAWNTLSRAEVGRLPEILAAMDDASPLAANWLRAAVESIAERQLNGGGPLPLKELEEFVFQRTHDPRARRLAFEWLVRADTTAADRIIPQMLNDPSLELRRDAVARLLEQAEKEREEDQSGAVGTYRKALASARDADQVKTASEQLRKLGETVDLPLHFGFLMQWKLIGPFDNTDKKGFAVAYPPEEKIDLAATHKGKGKPVQWIDYSTADEYGHVDLNKALGKHMGVTAYAYAEFVSDDERTVDLRLGCINANKVWLNGKLLGQAEVYHAATRLDQYITRGTLKPGRNTILLKVCQNEQTEDWAQDWKFQFRICDATGTAVLSKDRPPTPTATTKTAAK